MQGTAAAAAAPRRRQQQQLVRSGAPAVSAWEKRMKMDQVKGGIRVFDGGDGTAAAARDNDEEGLRTYRRLRRNQSEAAGEKKKRRSWRTGEPVAIADGRLRRARSEKKNSAVEVGKNADGQEEGEDEEEEEDDVDDGDGEVEVGVDVLDAEKKEVVVVQEMDHQDEEAAAEKDIELMAIDKESVYAHQDEEDDQEMDNKAINPESVNQPQDKEEVKEESEDHNLEQEMINAAHLDERLLKPEPVRRSSEKKQMTDLRTIHPEPVKPLIPERKGTGNAEPMKPSLPGKKTIAANDQRASVTLESPKPSPEKRPAPAPINRMATKQVPNGLPQENHEEVNGSTQNYHGRLQSIVDLIMWKDVSKSAFVFGLGMFLLVSSSYAKDLKFNAISAGSYAALVYLGLIFIYKSVLHRGLSVDCEEKDERYIMREEDAIWLLRLVLPYINEVLIKIRSLFSGDPATTMKLALLLFAMARCGSFVTFWTLAKLVFFGVFIIPKVCASYSTQLARYGKFWVERFRDAWDSCAHKKAAAAALFTLIWNISSATARVWAVFMLVAAVKYYYQQRSGEGWNGPDDAVEEEEEPEAHQKPIKVGPGRARPEEVVVGPQQPRQRRGPIAGEWAGERTRVRGGIQRR